MGQNRFALLFDPIKIGPVTAPNRFYAVPHATGHGWNQPNGANALRAMKAAGGWGTVAVQITEIAADSDMANHPMERLWDDSDLPRHAAQVRAIKQHGALAAIELGHGGARARNITTGLPPIGPSALPVLRPEVPTQARAMDLADIRDFRQSHRAAAKRAKIAGYDILYVYAAHDLSLLSHFLSLRTNQRTDSYGGNLENRVRLLREVLEDTAEVAAGECAVALRFSVAEPDKSMGLRHDGEGREVVEMLAELPDLWDVNIAGWPQDSATARFADEGFQLPFTDFVKSITTKPVVGVGRFTSPDTMVSLLKAGRLDLIGGARPSIADPFLPAKIREGRVEDIRECIGCNICVSMDSYGLPVRCTQNPTISEEWRRDWHPEVIPMSRNRQSHLIVGAGPAGLECAWTLVRAGHKVTVAEAESEAGGRVSRESRLPGLGTWSRVRDYRLYQLSQRDDADIFLSSPLTGDDIASFEADSVILATGASWRADGVGASHPSKIDLGRYTVITPDDILSGRQPAPAGTTMVIYDDDHFYMASAVCELLQGTGMRCHYVTPLPTVATWTDLTLEQNRIIDRLVKLGVTLHVNVALGSDGRFAHTLTGAFVPIDAAHLVLVGARHPNDQAHQALKAQQPDRPISLIGDCLVPGTIQAAVLSGHQGARTILASAGNEAVFRRDQITQLD